MKNKIYTLLLGVFFSFSGQAQEAGYYGKNFFLEFDGLGQLPVFTNVFHDKGYSVSSNKLKESFNLVDYTFRASLLFTNDEFSASGFEFGLRNFYINPQKGDEINRQIVNTDGSISSESVNAKAAMIPVQEIQLMSKVSISPSSRTPAGFSHEFGIGYSMIRIMDQAPLVEVHANETYTSEEISENFVDYRMKETKGLVFAYGVRMNHPISKSLLFHYGFRYQYNAMLGRKKYKNYEYTDSWFSGREIWSAMNARRQLGIMSFAMGFTVCF